MAAAQLARGRRGGDPRFWLGLAALLVAFVSPLCALSSALFAARVVHHVVLIAVAAPLLALALPRLHAGNLALLAAIHAASMWVWHAPQAYSAALAHDVLYWLMQASLLLPAVLFWRTVFAASAPAAAVGLLAFMAQMGLLGALISLSPEPLYAPHANTTHPWGLTPLEDQQLGGLIMWAPASIPYLAAALAQMHRWLAEEAAPAGSGTA